MRLRKQALGDRNLIGARVELARKNQGMKQKDLLAQLQVSGVDMNASGLSKLEGQIRFVTDFELVALADILDVSVGCWDVHNKSNQKTPFDTSYGVFLIKNQKPQAHLCTAAFSRKMNVCNVSRKLIKKKRTFCQILGKKQDRLHQVLN